MKFTTKALSHIVVGVDIEPAKFLYLSAGYNFRRAYELKAAGESHWAGLTAGGDKQTKLTTKENELLALLCSHANEILQRDFALKTIWIDDNYFNARSMDVYITKLRKHLKDDDQIEIINIHGKGYKLITPDEE